MQLHELNKPAASCWVPWLSTALYFHPLGLSPPQQVEGSVMRPETGGVRVWAWAETDSRCFSSRLCSSYPQKLLVPIWITDKELESVASFRSWKRIPVVVYRWACWPTPQLALRPLWFTQHVFWLCGSQASEERGSDRSLQPAWDQLVGMEEYGWRVPGDVHRQGLPHGHRSQGDSSQPAERGGSRLLW